jgi:hypothetical protein
MMGPPPDITPLLIVGLLAIPLAAWKIIEIVVWITAHLRWVSP